MNYSDEKQLAKVAEEKLTTALRSWTGGFKAHISGEVPSLREAKAVSKIKQYKYEDGRTVYFMRNLSIRMARHGFLQNFGADVMRAGGFRNREKPNRIRYYYRPHQFDLPSQPWINEAVNASGVIDFVMENVAQIRTEDLVFHVKRSLEKEY